jgi:hypothetical protein
MEKILIYSEDSGKKENFISSISLLFMSRPEDTGIPDMSYYSYKVFIAWFVS